MRLAFIIPRFPSLSETFVVREVLGLRKIGFDVDIYSYCAPSEKSRIHMATDWQALIPDVYYAETNRCKFMIRGALHNILARPSRLLRKLQKNAQHAPNWFAIRWRAIAIADQVRRHPDTAFIFGHWSTGVMLAGLVHELTNIPYGASMHDREMEKPEFNWYLPAIADSLSFAAFCTDANLRLFVKACPSQAEKAHLLYHGVNLNEFRPSPLESPPPPLRVISVGRLVPGKGFERLLLSCHHVLQLGKEIELTIIGDGPLFEQLHMRAQAIGFEKNLHMPGWIPHNEIKNYLRRSHVFVFLSDYFDGLPNVVLEAMACGRAVMVSDMPSILEAVHDGENGVVINKIDDPEYIAQRFMQFIANPEILEIYGKAGRRTIEDHYDEQIWHKKLGQQFQIHGKQTLV